VRERSPAPAQESAEDSVLLGEGEHAREALAGLRPRNSGISLISLRRFNQPRNLRRAPSALRCVFGETPRAPSHAPANLLKQAARGLFVGDADPAI
jgi:hypothetical protein